MAFPEWYSYGNQWALSENGRLGLLSDPEPDFDLTNVSAQQNGTLTYNGLGQRATVTTTATAANDETVTFTYSSKQDGTYTEAPPAFTNAGNYTVYYKASAANHNDVIGSFRLDFLFAGLLNIPLRKNTLTVEVRHVGRRKTDTSAAGASPAMLCTASGEMVHRDRADGALPPRLSFIP